MAKKKKKKKQSNKVVTMEFERSGVSFWQNGVWILDASVFLTDNEIYIDTKAFDVITDDNANLITLKAKKFIKNPVVNKIKWE